MGWLEGILEFLRHGPKGGKLDMNALFQGAVDTKQIDKAAAIAEIDALIKWQEERKKWHQDKTRQKMAAESTPGAPGFTPSSTSLANGSSASANDLSQPQQPNTFRSSDFGLHEDDLADFNGDDDDDSSDLDEEDEEEMNGGGDPIACERKRRQKIQDRLRRTAGEPVKPEVKQLQGMREGFLAMLRMVLAD